MLHHSYPHTHTPYQITIYHDLESKSRRARFPGMCKYNINRYYNKKNQPNKQTRDLILTCVSWNVYYKTLWWNFFLHSLIIVYLMVLRDLTPSKKKKISTQTENKHITHIRTRLCLFYFFNLKKNTFLPFFFLLKRKSAWLHNLWLLINIENDSNSNRAH